MLILWVYPTPKNIYLSLLMMLDRERQGWNNIFCQVVKIKHSNILQKGREPIRTKFKR